MNRILIVIMCSLLSVGANATKVIASKKVSGSVSLPNAPEAVITGSMSNSPIVTGSTNYNHAPIHWHPQLTQRCITYQGAVCFITPLPVGSSCYCNSWHGPLGGVMR